MAPAASTFGGFVTGYYGGASVADDDCCDYDDPTYSNYGIEASLGGGPEDVTNESRFYVGVSMLFGGGSLRDIHTNSTPMIDNSFNNMLAVYTSTLD